MLVSLVFPFFYAGLHRLQALHPLDDHAGQQRQRRCDLGCGHPGPSADCADGQPACLISRRLRDARCLAACIAEHDKSMSLKLITPAAALAVTLAEAKAHVRQDQADDDALITAMITAATELAEQYMGARSIMPQTWELSEEGFPDEFHLGRVPVASVTSIKYLDSLGVEQTLHSSAYVLDNYNDSSTAEIEPAYGTCWPIARYADNSVKVRFVSGYANAAAVPESIKSWIKLMVGAMYANRDAYTERKLEKLGFADGLLDRYKVYA